MMRHPFLIAALAAPLLPLGACHRASEAPAIGRAWVRLPAVSGQPGAAYFTIRGGRAATRLARIESALAARAELHESMAGVGGMMAMRPLDGIDVPAGGTIAFAPGGRHAMLFSIDPAVKPGTAIPLRFGFTDGRTAEAEAKTVAAGEDAPY